jgi:hypothetical protein
MTTTTQGFHMKKSKLTPKEKAEGELLSLLTVFLKANKTNNPAILMNFFRERLGSRDERRQLNVEINRLIGSIKKRTVAQRKYPKGSKLISESVNPASPVSPTGKTLEWCEAVWLKAQADASVVDKNRWSRDEILFIGCCGDYHLHGHSAGIRSSSAHLVCTWGEIVDNVPPES